jgi:hypothetical protein
MSCRDGAPFYGTLREKCNHRTVSNCNLVQGSAVDRLTFVFFSELWPMSIKKLSTAEEFARLRGSYRGSTISDSGVITREPANALHL